MLILNIIKTAIYGVFIYMGIETGNTKVLSILMVVDTIIGVVKIKRLGEKFSLGKLLWGLLSKLMVLLIPMTVALVGKGLDLDFVQFVIIVMNIIIVNEGLSIITNIYVIRTKKKIENTDFISVMLQAIRGVFTKALEKMIDLIEKFNVK